MQGDARDGLTFARETYFLDFAKEMLFAARMPLMVTAGIRRIEAVGRVLDAAVVFFGGNGSGQHFPLGEVGEFISNWLQIHSAACSA
jgi:hypothetical protein